MQKRAALENRQLISSFSLTLFGLLGFSGNLSLCFHWLYLAFLDFQATDLSVFIDSIWLFGIFRQLGFPFSLTLFGLLGFSGNLSLCFHWLYLAFWDFQATDSSIFAGSFRYFTICRQGDLAGCERQGWTLQACWRTAKISDTVFHTLMNRIGCSILQNCYNSYKPQNK